MRKLDEDSAVIIKEILAASRVAQPGLPLACLSQMHDALLPENLTVGDAVPIIDLKDEMIDPADQLKVNEVADNRMELLRETTSIEISDMKNVTNICSKDPGLKHFVDEVNAFLHNASLTLTHESKR